MYYPEVHAINFVLYFVFEEVNPFRTYLTFFIIDAVIYNIGIIFSNKRAFSFFVIIKIYISCKDILHYYNLSILGYSLGWSILPGFLYILN